MIQLKSYDQWTRLSDGKSFANALVMPGEIIDWIESDSAFYICKDDATALLVDQRDFYRMYILAKGDALVLDFEECDKPILVEFSYKGEMSETQREIARAIERQGFSAYTTEQRYSLSLADAASSKEAQPSQTAKSENVVHRADVSQLEAIIKLWDDMLKPYQTMLPPQSSLATLAEDGYILTIGDKPQAAMLIRIKGTTATFGSVAVDAAHQGKGLASQMYDAALASLPSTVSRVVAWIENGNVASEHLHIKKGFSPEQITTASFLRPFS